ncbi:LOW QUALITY PROTEIN: prepronociceptin [Antrostomus carolinensis]|uniref:LOW QUALITY PROTEIN: prepronociceptin n=1 Tax=Antrostomus carolinensis TaxID=279965 RepID=UPI0005289E59|nr:LOW QUALITY PROTEIN: prepronociceptin [Antrostomus carolinensis]
MRAVIWDLLLLCLFARVRGDCRGDCLHCDRQLYRDSFDVLICILECEGEAVPRATWELCAAAAAGRAAPRPRDLQDTDDPWHEAAMNRLEVNEMLRRRESEDEGVEEAPPVVTFQQAAEDISRGYGGFPRGTRGSWPAPMAKGVQKRYGGFIGVRKSARKWNNQKRFSEFLKQYLGMSPRSSEYGIAGGERNEI